MAEITFSVDLLTAIRREGKPWALLLSELIDNSLDANARTVDIRFGAKSVEVEDNGAGMANVESVLHFGDHVPHGNAGLGRYGIGLKHALVTWWGVSTIRTVRDGRASVLRVDWERQHKSRSLKVPDPLVERGEGHGTVIRCTKIQPGMPKYDKLVEEIEATFSPALRDGVQIAFSFPKKKMHLCRPVESPPFCETLMDSFSIDGRGVDFKIGIVEEGYANPRPGFAFQHGHRVLRTNSFGANGCSTQRVAGWVKLDRKWTLTTNKQWIDDDEAEGLRDALYQRWQPLLERAAQQSTVLITKDLDTQLNERFRQLLKDVQKKLKERRDTADEPQSGTVEPKKTGRKRTPKKTQPDNDNLRGRNAGQFIIDWRSLDDGSVGYADLDGNRVWLNETHAKLIEYRASGTLDPIITACAGIYAESAVREDRTEKLFPKRYGSVVELWGMLLDGLTIAEVDSAHAKAS